MAREVPVAQRMHSIAASLADAHDSVERLLYALQLDARLTGDIDVTQQALSDLFGNAADIMITTLFSRDGVQVLTIFNQSMVHRDLLIRAVFDRIADTALGPQPDLDELTRHIVPTGITESVDRFGELATHVIEGSAILCLPGCTRALAIQLAQAPQRSISQAPSEPVVMGPRDGFIEDASTNLTLVRRRIRSPRLWVDVFRLGDITRTTVYLLHLHGVTDDELVDEARRRISSIRIDGVLESNYVAELIRDAPGSPFPTIQRTERPDKVAAGLLEGQFAVIVDGSPFALVAPITFGHLFKASEDYYESWFPSSILRGIRVMAVVLGVLVPSLYVAVVTYHQELIPTSLLIVLAASRENVPLPTIVELLLILVLFEIIREAGVRTPSGIGSAVTIGGTLVVGQAAVRAGIVSSPIIIVTSAVVIQFLAAPDYELVQVSRFMLYPILIASSAMGLFGLLFASLALVLHLTSLRSFGVPYLAPLAPARARDWKDLVLRAPWWAMNTRPQMEGGIDPVRQPPNQVPLPPAKQP